jgi:hypothetical protein
MRRARKAPSIAIPTAVHRKYSETYGGRNNARKQAADAFDLRMAVDTNFDALKPGLIESGFSESEIELGRDLLHKLSNDQGWY